MNFGINISDDMDETFMKNNPYFEDITKCTYQFRRLLISRKARFRIEGVNFNTTIPNYFIHY